MFRFAHNNFYVTDLERSLKFYKEVLNLTEVKRVDEGYSLVVYLGDEMHSHYMLELIWRKDGQKMADMGKAEFHIALSTDDYEAAKAKHTQMGVIEYEVKELGCYFIMDPDGYWINILPEDLC